MPVVLESLGFLVNVDAGSGRECVLQLCNGKSFTKNRNGCGGWFWAQQDKQQMKGAEDAALYLTTIPLPQVM